jgi:hypothetical protein
MTTTKRLTMKGTATAPFTYGTTTRSTGEAFALLKARTTEARSATTRIDSARYALAQALRFVKVEGLALTLYAPKDRGGQGGSAFSTYYQTYLGMTEGEVSGLVSWASVVEDLGTMVPFSHAKAMASVPPASLRAVYDKSIELGKGKGATRSTIDAARKALKVPAPTRSKGKGKGGGTPPAPPAPPAPDEPVAVGIVEGANLLAMALKTQGRIELTKSEKALITRLIKGLTTLLN